MISVTGVIIAGFVASIVFSIFIGMARAMGMTSMSIEKTLGAMFGEGTGATLAGWAMHFVSGIIFAVIYVSIFNSVGTTNGWLGGAVIGLVHGLLVGSIVMPIMGIAHPAIRTGNIMAPGFFAKNAGTMTPVGLIVGHVIFGAVLGGIYFLVVT